MKNRSLIAASTAIVVSVGVANSVYSSNSNFTLQRGFDTREKNGYIIYSQQNYRSIDHLGSRGQNCPLEKIIMTSSPNHIAELTSDFDNLLYVVVSTSGSDRLDPIIIVQSVKTGRYYCSDSNIAYSSGGMSNYGIEEEEINGNSISIEEQSIENELYEENPVEVELFSTDFIQDKTEQGVYRVWIGDRNYSHLKGAKKYNIAVAEQENLVDVSFLSSY